MQDKIDKMVTNQGLAKIFCNSNLLEKQKSKWIKEKKNSIYYLIGLHIFGLVTSYGITTYFSNSTTPLLIFSCCFILMGMFVLAFRYNAKYLLDCSSSISKNPILCQNALTVSKSSEWANNWRNMVLSQGREFMVADEKIMSSLAQSQILDELKNRGQVVCKELHGI